MSEVKSHRAYLSLGSNIDPETNLPAAVNELQQFGQVANTSQVWETLPLGYSDQANFLNAAVLLETEYDADEIIKSIIPTVETALKRQRDPNNKNGPRTIDVDLSLFDDDCFTVGEKSIPDSDILVRSFVAIPLAEIAPDLVHPVENQTLAEIAARFDSQDRQTMKLRADVLI